MSNPQTTAYGDIGTRSGVALEKAFLKRAQNFLILERFGQVSVQERNKGTTRKFREIKSLSITNALTPVVEGVTPDGQKIVTRDVRSASTSTPTSSAPRTRSTTSTRTARRSWPNSTICAPSRPR